MKSSVNSDFIRKEEYKKFEQISKTNILVSKISIEKMVKELGILWGNPRFPDTSEFQIFYKKNIGDKIEVAFHEILHFIFFNYCTKNLLDETCDLNKNSGKLWELSEIVNVIVLNLPKFRSVIEREEKLFYPNLQGKLEIVRDIWNNRIDMKQFIVQSLNVL